MPPDIANLSVIDQNIEINTSEKCSSEKVRIFSMFFQQFQPQMNSLSFSIILDKL